MKLRSHSLIPELILLLAGIVIVASVYMLMERKTAAPPLPPVAVTQPPPATPSPAPTPAGSAPGAASTPADYGTPAAAPSGATAPARAAETTPADGITSVPAAPPTLPTAPPRAADNTTTPRGGSTPTPAVPPTRATAPAHAAENTSTSAARTAPVPVAAPAAAPAATQRRATCSVGHMGHSNFTAPLSPGQHMGQLFLDSDVQLTAGPNCGLSADALQAAPRGEWRLLVNIDTEGTVEGGQLISSDHPAGPDVLAAARRSWRFNAPKVNGIPVKTSVYVVVRIY